MSSKFKRPAGGPSPAAPTWTPFERMTVLRYADGTTRPIPPGTLIYRNAIYQVAVRSFNAGAPFGRGLHLSIKRTDRQPLRDWRHMQRIKNELVGPEAEAVELFPQESRKVDSANQYHLWVFPEYRFPWGQEYREVSTPEENATDPDPDARSAVQAPFEPGDPWNATTGPLAPPGPSPRPRGADTL